MRNFLASQAVTWITALFVFCGTNPSGVLLSSIAGPPAILASIWSHSTFCGIFVEKVTYLPRTKQFKFSRRSFLGNSYDELVDVAAILYTNDSDLNRKDINYINMGNLKKYSIGLPDSWIDEHYFSY